jgi:hypothetical protein
MAAKVDEESELDSADTFDSDVVAELESAGADEVSATGDNWAVVTVGARDAGFRDGR